MPVTRVEICTEHLKVDDREALLDAAWSALRISPGMVSADGNVELALVQCGAAVKDEDTPLVRVNELEYRNITPEKLVTLLRRWAR